MWDEYLENRFQSWQEHEEQRHAEAMYAAQCEEMEYQAVCIALDKAIAQLGVERVLNYVQHRQIEMAPPAPRPEPTQFNGISID